MNSIEPKPSIASKHVRRRRLDLKKVKLIAIDFLTKFCTHFWWRGTGVG